MVSMDTLIMKVMNFAQRLVSADRASLFLVDNKNRQLYARIFDIGSDSTAGPDTPQASKEIRYYTYVGIHRFSVKANCSQVAIYDRSKQKAWPDFFGVFSPRYNLW